MWHVPWAGVGVGGSYPWSPLVGASSSLGGLTAASAGRVVKEEISDDNAKLPCFNGRVVSWVSVWDVGRGCSAGVGVVPVLQRGELGLGEWVWAVGGRRLVTCALGALLGVAWRPWESLSFYSPPQLVLAEGAHSDAGSQGTDGHADLPPPLERTGGIGDSRPPSFQ